MMSRLTGGIGGRGPGETKLEINRRRARERIHRLEKEIDRFGEQRAGRRAERDAARRCRSSPSSATPTPASPRCSTRSPAATCWPRTSCSPRSTRPRRRLRFPREREIIITDTVGFIRDLPKDLARAFRATLEELDEADLLLHVVDAADPAREQQIAAVEAILADLGLAETPRILVLNKVDLLPDEERALLRARRARAARRRHLGAGRRTTAPCWRRSRPRWRGGVRRLDATPTAIAARALGRRELAVVGRPPSRCCWAC